MYICYTQSRRDLSEIYPLCFFIRENSDREWPFAPTHHLGLEQYTPTHPLQPLDPRPNHKYQNPESYHQSVTSPQTRDQKPHHRQTSLDA